MKASPRHGARRIVFAGMTLFFYASSVMGDAADTLLKRYESQIEQQERQLRSLKDRLVGKEREAERWQKMTEEAKTHWSQAGASAERARRAVQAVQRYTTRTRALAEAAEWSATEHRLMAQASDEQLAYWARELHARRLLCRPSPLTVRERIPEYVTVRLCAFSQTAHQEISKASRQEASLRMQEMRWQDEERRRTAELDRWHEKRRAQWLRWQEAQRRRAALVEEISQMEQSRQALHVMLQELRQRHDHALVSRQGYPADRRALAILRGTLPWPAPGKVTQNFGRHYSDELKQLMISNGIKIEAGAGRTIRSVQSGKVLFANPFRQYGRLVIVQHRNGLTSVYGGLGQTSVKEGDQLAALDAIGAAAGEGHFYFELRLDEQPVNPLVYLTPNTRHTDISLRRTFE